MAVWGRRRLPHYGRRVQTCAYTVCVCGCSIKCEILKIKNRADEKIARISELTGLWEAVDDTMDDTCGCSGCIRRGSCRLAQGESRSRILGPWDKTGSGATAKAVAERVGTARP